MGRAFEYRRAAKEKRWAKMSRIFPKLAKAITIAAKEGGADPEMNAKLRVAIQNAKAENLPKANIAAAIDRATGKDGVDYTEVLYEGKGPHGSLVIVECATDNTTRTVANVKAAFSKSGGQMVPNGSLQYMFDRKAVFEFKATDEMDMEELELELIDAGLTEIEKDDETGTVYVYGEYTDFGNLSEALNKLGIEADRSTLEFQPTQPIDVSGNQREEIEKLVDKLEDDDDVQAVYTNLD
jgi:YebC/PmpR family DNA-binding regulatory protein